MDGLLPESYGVVKNLAKDVYEALSLVFPSIPGWVAGQRTQCLINVIDKAQKKLDASGLPKDQIRACSLKLGIPWIENASLEKEPLLQDLWANLLANALIPGKKADRYPRFVSILKELSPLDAKLLSLISSPIKIEKKPTLTSGLFEDSDGEIRHANGTLLTPGNTQGLNLSIIGHDGQSVRIGLPKKVEKTSMWKLYLDYLDVSQEEIQVSADTLENLGLVATEHETKGVTIGGTAPLLARGVLQLTQLGFAFVDACIEDAGQTAVKMSMQKPLEKQACPDCKS